MLVDEKIDRFASNFGRSPLSVALAADWTTPPDATNIEMAGPSFDNESDFGNAGGGFGGLGFVNTFTNTNVADNGLVITVPTTLSGFIPDFASWDWHEWALALGAGYTLYNIFKTKAAPKVQRYKKRKELLASEKEIYKNRRKKVEKDYPLFS